MSLLEVIHLRKVFKRSPLAGSLSSDRSEVVAVNDLSLVIQVGEIQGLVGESGSGKSTLANCILGLQAPTAGEVRFRGRSLTGKLRRPLAGEIQAIFQDPHESLNPRMTVLRILLEPLEILGTGSPTWRRERAREVMHLVGLAPDLAEQRSRQLSGGQKQRVAIARSLVGEPKLLIADEPVSALDVSVQAQILNLLAELRTKLDLTILLISHDFGVVGQLCDRVAVMVQGRLVEMAPTELLFGSARHPYTQSLLEAIIPESAPAAREWVSRKGPSWQGEIGPLQEAAPGHWVASINQGQELS